MRSDERIEQVEVKSRSREDRAAVRHAAIETLACGCMDPADLSAFVDVELLPKQAAHGFYWDNKHVRGLAPWAVETLRQARARLPGAKRRLEERRRAFARCRTPEAARALYLRYCPTVKVFDAPTEHALQEMDR